MAGRPAAAVIPSHRMEDYCALPFVPLLNALQPRVKKLPTSLKI
jgi:hypothetical protein